MSHERQSRLEPVFRWIVAKRWWVVAAWAALLVPSAWFATKVEQDNSIDRLIVQSDPDYQRAKAFDDVFGGGEYIVLVAEASDPFAPEVIARVDAIEQAVASLPHVSANSPVGIWRKAKAGADPAKDPEGFKAFLTGTDLFRKQGLAGDGFLAIALVLDVHDRKASYETVATIDRAIQPFEQDPGPLARLRKVGQPYVIDMLDRGTTQAGMRCFPFFFAFVVVLCLYLYRSWRALAAFVICLGANVAVGYGYIGLVGGTLTMVSAMVPMTVLITCMATLVYVHSRFVERPPERSVDDHQVFSLANKFLACTASIFAAAVGFAALAVSEIRPIREMGIWIAVGLAVTWLVTFTLFPALQKILDTPTQVEQKTAAQWFLRLIDVLPTFSWRWRWALVPGALALCGVGAVALFGLPGGALAPMSLETNPVEYVPHGSQLYQDTKWLKGRLPGLAVTEIWLEPRHKGTKDAKTLLLTDAKVLRGLEDFQRALEQEQDPKVGSVVGSTSILRMIRYLGGHGDQLPADDDELEDVAFGMADLSAQFPLLGRFVRGPDFNETHITVVTEGLDYAQYEALTARVKALWEEAVAREPALAELSPTTTGMAPLQAKISHHLVPTLTESFALTVSIIFLTFLFIFRNGAARLMAMIPSLFAILVMFAVMRASGYALNVATILVASTVLGTSENDQIHFFYHFLEKHRGGTTEGGLRHTILIAGRPIFFATLINAGGFLAFALSDMPPMREFAFMASLAFVLSMIADFTALPAALWMVFRDKPDAFKPAPAAPALATAEERRG